MYRHVERSSFPEHYSVLPKVSSSSLWSYGLSMVATGVEPAMRMSKTWHEDKLQESG